MRCFNVSDGPADISGRGGGYGPQSYYDQEYDGGYGGPGRGYGPPDRFGGKPGVLVITAFLIISSFCNSKTVEYGIRKFLEVLNDEDKNF